MSRSHHANYTHLRGYSEKELDEMAKDPDSILHQLADKIKTKNTAREKRKLKKQIPLK